MDVIEAIETRRSGRVYTDRPIDGETVRRLISLGICAPTASRLEPWGFAVIQDKEKILGLSDVTKAYLLEHMAPRLEQYRSWFENPSMNLFYGAGTLLLIYGNPDSPWYRHDCSMVAQNIMLAAHSMGIGTCWIGFAKDTLNTPAFKAEHRVPEDWQLVSAMSMGYYGGKAGGPAVRRDPVIFSWEKA